VDSPNTPSPSPETQIQPQKPSAAENGNGDDSALDDLPPELTRSMPPQLRSQMSAFFSASGPMQHPLTKKITPGHIDKALDFVSEEGKRRHTGSMTDKFIHVGVVVVGLAFMLILVGMLKDSPDMLRLVMTGLLTFLGGLGLGRAWGRPS